MTDNLAPTRPYLIRAMHEWMTDNGQTPLVVVDTMAEGVNVPAEHIRDNHIVLNIAWSATRNLQMGNDFLQFDARFGGVSRSVDCPISAVKGIYARESGKGMMFQDEPNGTSVGDIARPSAPDKDQGAAAPKRPSLRVVK